MHSSKIYFCASIRGGRQLSAAYAQIIAILRSHGEVLTEHLGDDREIELQDGHLEDRQIHDRDLEWIRESDMLVAEVTVPSLGVGYEIGRSVEMGKPVICLFREESGIRLSAMINGSKDVEVVRYNEPKDLSGPLKAFVTRHAPGRTSGSS